MQVTSEGELVNRFAKGKYMFFITITYPRCQAFKTGDLNQFSYTPSQDRYHWKEMMLWFHETTFTNKSEAATC
jgi:hypothetical protein